MTNFDRGLERLEPAITRRYDAVSVDFWGGLSNGRYVGYRGKPIGTSLGHQVWIAL